jgi:hypothetical protein
MVDSAAAGLIATLPKIILAVFVFLIIFAVFNFLGFIVYLFTKGLIDGKLINGRKIKRHKLLGGLTGAVNGVLIAFLALSPVLGFADFVQPFAANATVRNEIGKVSPEILDYVDMYTSYGEKDSDFVKKILGFNGIDVEFFNRITRVKNSDGTEISAADLKEFSAIIDDAAWFYENMETLSKFQELSDEELNALIPDIIVHADGIIDFLFKNKITNIILSDGLNYLKANRDNLEFLNGIPPQFKGAVDAVLDEILGAGSGAVETENVRESLKDFIALAGGLAPQIRYFIANADALGGIADGSLPAEKQQELISKIKETFGVVLGNNKKELITNLLADLVSAALPDKSLSLPLGGFFRGLGELENAEAVNAELDGLFGALETVGGIMSGGGDLNMVEVLLGVGSLLADGSGNASLTGKVLLSVVSNTLIKMTAEQKGEPVDESLYVEISDLTNAAWNAEVALFGGIFAEIGEIMTAFGSLEPNSETFMEEQLALLIECGGIFDELKLSKVFDNSYNPLIGMLFEEMGLAEALATFGFELDPNIDYRTVSFEATFNMMLAMGSLGTQLSNVEETLGDFLDGVANGNVDPTDPEVIGEVFTAVADALGTDGIAMIQQLFDGLVSEGVTVEDILDSIPDSVFNGLGSQLGLDSETIESGVVADFFKSFLTYVGGLDAGQSA